MNTIDDKFSFGQYKGLTIKEVFQGTLNIEKKLIIKYLNEILNNKSEYAINFNEIEFIERFDIDNQQIKIVGQIYDETKPLNESNRISFGNLEDILSSYVNNYWKENNLGILKNIKEFAKENDIIHPLGGDPEYLIWCDKNVSEFNLNEKIKRKLEKFTVTRFKGISFLFKGMNEYDYREIIEFENYKFK